MQISHCPMNNRLQPVGVDKELDQCKKRCENKGINNTGQLQVAINIEAVTCFTDACRAGSQDKRLVSHPSRSGRCYLRPSSGNGSLSVKRRAIRRYGIGIKGVLCDAGQGGGISGTLIK